MYILITSCDIDSSVYGLWNLYLYVYDNVPWFAAILIAII